MGKATFSGPVAGAYFTTGMHLGAGAAACVLDDILPPGMTMKIFAIAWFCDTATTTPSFTVGTSADADGLYDSGALSGTDTDKWNQASLSGALVDSDGNYDFTGGDSLEVAVTGTFTGLHILFHGYITNHTAALDQDGV